MVVNINIRISKKVEIWYIAAVNVGVYKKVKVKTVLTVKNMGEGGPIYWSPQIFLRFCKGKF